jgi:CDP-diacylglycerol--serine O-phosphatidyltransferase
VFTSGIGSSAEKQFSERWGQAVLDNTSLLRRRREDRPNRFRRGVFLLPSLFTVANLFCGYACVVYSTRSDFDTAALFIGFAMVLDTLDGFFARLTHSSSAFGVELDSLADVVSFGLGPAILAFTWGLWPLERLGWAAGFLYVTAAAMRLARFNVQTTTTTASTDKRYFVGMPSPAAASVIASTVYLYPYGLQEREAAFPALAMVLVPAFLMVSTIRFRSVKAIDVGHTRSYFSLFLAAVALALVATHPRIALVVLSYTYTATALIMWGYTKLRRRPTERASDDHPVPDSSGNPY